MAKHRVTLQEVERAIQTQIVAGIPEAELVRNLTEVAALMRFLKWTRFTAYSHIEDQLIKTMLNGVTQANREAAKAIIEELHTANSTKSKVALERYNEKYP
jgi:hypothetical protein